MEVERDFLLDFDQAGETLEFFFLDFVHRGWFHAVEPSEVVANYLVMHFYSFRCLLEDHVDHGLAAFVSGQVNFVGVCWIESRLEHTFG